MPKVIKPSNPFTNVCWVSVLTTFLRRLARDRQFLFLPNSRNEEMMWVMVFFGATAAGFILNSKRLLSTSCNKQYQRR